MVTAVIFFCTNAQCINQGGWIVDKIPSDPPFDFRYDLFSNKPLSNEKNPHSSYRDQ